MDFARKILASILLLLIISVGSSLGAVHEVGDSAGWTIMGNVDYNKWASSKDFHVGDSILFQYNNQFHNVKQVSLQDFQTCHSASPIATYTTGSDSITLKSPGNYYFLCGFPGHCEAGQKLEVMVTPASLRPSASPRSAPSALPPSSGPSSSSQNPDESDASSLHIFSCKPWSALVISLAIFVIGLGH